jgi:hypothetical protein
VTQQYIVGELSSLLAALEPANEMHLEAAVGHLRHEVEFASLARLPRLARDALDLMDMFCWSALERGDTDAFYRHVRAADALRDFAVASGLVP